MVTTFTSEDVQTSQTWFHKSMPQQDQQESQFTIAFQTIVSFSLMIHSHHSSSINILQTLLMVGCPKINYVIFFHLINYSWGSWSIRDFVTIHKCWKENEVNLRLEFPLTTINIKLTIIYIFNAKFNNFKFVPNYPQQMF